MATGAFEGLCVVGVMWGVISLMRKKMERVLLPMPGSSLSAKSERMRGWIAEVMIITTRENNSSAVISR